MTFTIAIDEREVTIQATTLVSAKRAARKEFDEGYIDSRIRIWEHTETHGPIVVSVGYVGRKGWRNDR